MNQDKIGKFIQQKRKEKELTQVQLAEKLNVSNKSVSKWENGRCLPDVSLYKELCDVLDITLPELLTGEEISDEHYKEKIEENLVESLEKNKKYKKWFKRIIKLIIFLVVVWILFKFIALKILFPIYKTETNDKSRMFPYNTNIKDIVIKNDVEANANLDELYYKVPKEFELITDKDKSYHVYDAHNTYQLNTISKTECDAYMTIGHAYQVDALNFHYNNLGDFGLGGPLMNPSSLMSKYNINDEIELIKYYQKNPDKKQTIFTKTSEIELNSLAYHYTSLIIPDYEEMYFFDGNFRGFFTHKDQYYYGIIYGKENSNSNYTFTFKNENKDYFTYDKVIEFLSSLKKEQ